MYKREVVEQHEKGFHNTIRQVVFIAKDRDLSHFYLFKDVKDSVMLDEEDIVVEGEVGEEQDVEKQGDDANVQATFCLFSYLLGFWP